MTLFQDATSVQKPITSERALAAPFLAIMAGLVVVLMAVAVTAFVAAGRSADTAIQAEPYTEGFDGWMPGAIAAARQHRIEAAQSLTDGWEAALVRPRTITATDGWEAVLIQPREAEVEATIYRFLLPDDQAAVGGSSLRFAPQPAEAPTDGYNLRSIHVD